VDTLETTRDKLKTLQTLGANQVPIPKTMIARYPFEYETIRNEFEYPLILKKSSGSQGKAVLLVQNERHLKDLEGMLDVRSPLIFQEYISSSHGKDVRVFVIDGEPIGAMLRIAQKGFKSNFHQGGLVQPIPLSDKIKSLVANISNSVKLDIAGIDFLINNDDYSICELNSSPGFEAFEMATGIDVAKKIIEFVSRRVEETQKNKRYIRWCKSPKFEKLCLKGKFKSIFDVMQQ
jgi:gamma-F420-2:alpha-L-glutamate ligase